MDSIVIQIASLHHVGYAHDISDLIEESAKKKGNRYCQTFTQLHHTENK